jgi:DNA-binding transcriptional MerR regulator
MNPISESPKFGIEDICRQTGLTRRTVRFYIEKGLLDKPFGEKKGAWYSQQHLERLARILQLSSAGLSLDAIAKQLEGGDGDVPRLETTAPGAVSVKSHITVARGVEVVVCPDQAQMRPEQLRRFIRLLSGAFNEVIQDDQ